jgi:hypothetical protein
MQCLAEHSTLAVKFRVALATSAVRHSVACNYAANTRFADSPSCRTARTSPKSHSAESAHNDVAAIIAQNIVP